MLDRSEKKKREREREREREIKFDCFKKLVDPSKNHNFLREILNFFGYNTAVYEF